MDVSSANAIADRIVFDDNGLVTAVAQRADGDNAVLMVAWMNREAVLKTLTTGDVYYWSRSRQELWRKGATSGHVQTLVDFQLDCDGDTVLMRIHQTGAACHTGAPTCFFTSFGR
jgi:phosphoribosyl-AMP cyclohydrolase